MPTAPLRLHIILRCLSSQARPRRGCAPPPWPHASPPSGRVYSVPNVSSASKLPQSDHLLVSALSWEAIGDGESTRELSPQGGSPDRKVAPPHYVRAPQNHVVAGNTGSLFTGSTWAMNDVRRPIGQKRALRPAYMPSERAFTAYTPSQRGGYGGSEEGAKWVQSKNGVWEQDQTRARNQIPGRRDFYTAADLVASLRRPARMAGVRPRSEDAYERWARAEPDSVESSQLISRVSTPHTPGARRMARPLS